MNTKGRRQGKPKRTMVHGRVPADAHAMLVQAARSCGVSLTTLISAAIEDYLRNVIRGVAGLPGAVPRKKTR